MLPMILYLSNLIITYVEASSSELLNTPFLTDFSHVLLLTIFFHIFTFTLYALVPARSIRGYVLRADGSPSRTRLPGFATLLVTAAAAAGIVYYDDDERGTRRASFLWDNFGLFLLSSLIFGLVVSGAFYVRGMRLAAKGDIDERPRCPTADQAEAFAIENTERRHKTTLLPRASAIEAEEFRSRSALAHFYAGFSEYNPEWLNVDIKMWLYATGATLLALHVASAVAADAVANGGVPRVAVATSAAMLCFFIIEYMWQEDVHCECV